MSQTDIAYMQEVLELAHNGLYTTFPNPRVACIIVKNGIKVAASWHQYAGDAHAEILALEQAAEKAQGATMYINLEPCSHHGRTPPCCEAIIKAGISKVICATKDTSAKVNGQGLKRLNEANIEVKSGILEKEAIDLNCGFFSLAKQGRPWIRLKFAMSLDGQIALKNGQSAWISSEASRYDVQFWRARSAAILTGFGTINHDNPQLNVRLSAKQLHIKGDVRQPLRIVADSHLQTSINAKIYQLPGPKIVATSNTDKKRHAEFEKKGVEVWFFESNQQRVPLQKLMQKLTALEIAEIQIEAGSRFAAAILKADLYDEILLYLAPCLLGQGKPLFEIESVKNMEQRHNLLWHDMTPIGDDIRLILRRS